MLRITAQPLPESEGRHLRVEGRLVGDWVGLLGAECDCVAVLDLSDLRFASAAGIRLLQECQARGVRLHQCPPFLKELCQDGCA